MITKASIRRFLWRHFPSLHEMIYDHFTEQEYQEMIDYILNKEKMALAKKDMMVLHPLPRVNEISVEVDEDERAMYFKQVRYGMFIRMALILTLLELV